jgi:hypothetical protein
LHCSHAIVQSQANKERRPRLFTFCTLVYLGRSLQNRFSSSSKPHLTPFNRTNKDSLVLDRVPKWEKSNLSMCPFYVSPGRRKPNSAECNAQENLFIEQFGNPAVSGPCNINRPTDRPTGGLVMGIANYYSGQEVGRTSGGRANANGITVSAIHSITVGSEAARAAYGIRYPRITTCPTLILRLCVNGDAGANFCETICTKQEMLNCQHLTNEILQKV